VQLTRHTKNRARAIKLSQANAEAIVARPDRSFPGKDGKPNYEGSIEGVLVRIVVALDDPDLIVTICERRR
jgi:hypothetical protein